MPIYSDKIRKIDEPGDAGLKCTVTERGRKVNEFQQFILTGLMENDELLITATADKEHLTVTIIELIKIYIKRWETSFRERYGYPDEVPVEAVVEELVRAAKEIDFDRPKSED